MEPLTEEVFDVISESGPMDDPIARRYLKELILGLQHIHNRGKAHRDIKLENVMFNDDYNMVYIDHGYVAELKG